MADFDDIELSGLTAAQLEELSELIDPDVSTSWLRYICVPVLVVPPVESYVLRARAIHTHNHKLSYVLMTLLSPNI